jgi:hypothetical protein
MGRPCSGWELAQVNCQSRRQDKVALYKPNQSMQVNSAGSEHWQGNEHLSWVKRLEHHFQGHYTKASVLVCPIAYQHRAMVAIHTLLPWSYMHVGYMLW